MIYSSLTFIYHKSINLNLLLSFCGQVQCVTNHRTSQAIYYWSRHFNELFLHFHSISYFQWWYINGKINTRLLNFHRVCFFCTFTFHNRVWEINSTFDQIKCEFVKLEKALFLVCGINTFLITQTALQLIQSSTQSLHPNP